MPREHVALYQACVLEQDFAKGRRIMAAMLPLMDYLEGGKFVQSIKYGCELAGLPNGGVRAPLKGMTAAEQAELAQVITALKSNVTRIVQGA